MTVIDDAISVVKKCIEECKAKGIEFEMPDVEGCVVRKYEATTPRHSTFVLELPDGRTIRIDSRSKDGSDLCHYEQERSYIKVECSDHSNDFTDSWEEKV